MIARIDRCRICGNERLETVLDLGVQAMTGLFPKTREEHVPEAPLVLMKCSEVDGTGCGLVQIAHRFDLSAMYGDGYGYRSGLNAAMVRHLHQKVQRILDFAPLRDGDLVIDVGSNDGTTLRGYPEGRFDLLGVDPTGSKFREYYPAGVELIPDFFSHDRVRARVGNRRARVITSFSMFYDLEAPLDFMREVMSLLEDDGVWIFEQSYLPAMLSANSYDTVCHEHIEYYGLSQIKWMTEQVGAKIVDIEFNDVNGGSFSVAVAKAGTAQLEAPLVASILEEEQRQGLRDLHPYHAFAGRVSRSREDLRRFVDDAKRNGRTVCGLGASTKGNVILQYCGMTASDIQSIGEVNADKVGGFTPGSLIPIVDEGELLDTNPDHLLVLPWHFRPFFETSPKFRGRPLVFPLPHLQSTVP